MVVHKCPFDIWDNWVSMISSSSELPCLLCDTPAVLLSVKEKECQQCLPLLFDYWDKQGTHKFGEYYIKYVFWIIKGGKGVICADWKHLSLLLICSIDDENQNLANAKKALWAISIAPNFFFFKKCFITLYLFIFHYIYLLIICVCVCVPACLCVHVSWHLWRSEGNFLELIFPFILQILGIELRSLGLAASALTSWTNLIFLKMNLFIHNSFWMGWTHVVGFLCTFLSSITEPYITIYVFPSVIKELRLGWLLGEQAQCSQHEIVSDIWMTFVGGLHC